MNPVRRALEHVDVPEEHEARERAWELLQAAFAEREPEPRRLPLRALAVAAAALAVVGAALSPPGRAVIDEVREVVGVEDAEPQLFSLPAPGRLLVTSERGAWAVQPDGSKRLLGRYRDAAWSPNGLFVAATRANELAALDPRGGLRWSLARPAVRLPSWGGSRSDTRIAYLSRGRLRVVAGDGSGDRALGGAAAAVRPAWRPFAGRHLLAYVARGGEVTVLDTDARDVLWRSAPVAAVRRLLWSRDGSRLTVVARDRVTVFAWNRRAPVSTRAVDRAADGALAPDGRLALALRRGDRTELTVSGRRVFSGPGTLRDLAWSPDGRWLLAAWPDADQWVFLRAGGPRRVAAVSRIATQFRSTSFPSVAGWCCPGETASTGSTDSAAGPEDERTPEAPASNKLSLATEVAWRRSTAVGLPWSGRLVRGVMLPAEGESFVTWDPVERRAPSPDWRRHGTDRLVSVLLRVIDEFAAAHPDAPRVLVGDLSRPHGGDFGPRWGGPGHVSHQNGLDADVYFPRRDRRERPPDRPEHVDRELAQDLVDRFVAAGAQKVFVGPNVGLTGPRGVVEELAAHDNHLHVRLPPAR